MKYKLNNGKIIEGVITNIVVDWIGNNVLNIFSFTREFINSATLALSLGYSYVLRIYFHNKTGYYFIHDYGNSTTLHKYMQEHLWDNTDWILEK